jgi:hypothetical protein
VVCLSSEAEYVAISEAVEEIRLTYYLSDSIVPDVALLIVVKCDIVDVHFMAGNSSSGHIDTRYHSVLQHIEHSFLKVVFVKSCENVADVSQKM